MALLAGSVSITAVAQIVLKAGMAGAAVQAALSGRPSIPMLFTILFQPAVFLGLALYFLAALIWLIVLSRIEVSTAYPFVAVGFVLTAVLGRLFFHETMSLAKVAGILLICSGVAVLARA